MPCGSSDTFMLLDLAVTFCWKLADRRSLLHRYRLWKQQWLAHDQACSAYFYRGAFCCAEGIASDLSCGSILVQ